MSPFTLRRRAARVVLLDSAGQVLLLAARDPADAGKLPWWEIPGGGIDPHEDTADAARRELRVCRDGVDLNRFQQVGRVLLDHPV